MFSDAGEGSFSRVVPGFIIFVMMALVTFVTIKDGKIPDLAGVALVISGAAAYYIGNKVSTAISDSK